MAEWLNGLNRLIWDRAGWIILLGAGVAVSCATGFFQVRHCRLWWRHTVGSLLRRGSGAHRGAAHAISPFQALCTALAATIGTGNIAGVSAAVMAGGPGAVFWMWVAAFFGMMTGYAENVLGILYRRRNRAGEWSGGPMYYLRYGLGARRRAAVPGRLLAGLFAVFTITASCGIGNMGQVNQITLYLQSAFFRGAPVGARLLIGLALTAACGLILLGGLKRIARVAERVVPLMAGLYLLGALLIMLMNAHRLGAIFGAIFRFAWGVRPAAGGAAGIAIRRVAAEGCKRGVFSNEAGLGSSVMIHASSAVREPAEQGMWSIFEVFFDTFVVCTVTAVAVLASGAVDLATGLPAQRLAAPVSAAFGQAFGAAGEPFVALAMLLFAFTTLLGWSQYGAQAAEYLWGARAAGVYRAVFVLMILPGALMTASSAWAVCDVFNGLMMLPNLIGVAALCPQVRHATRDYVNQEELASASES